MTVTHSGVVPKSVKDGLESVFKSNVGQWVDDWFGAKSESFDLLFHYSEVLFKPPVILNHIEGLGYGESEQLTRDVFVAELGEFGNQILKMAERDETEFTHREMAFSSLVANKCLADLIKQLGFGEGSFTQKPVLVVEIIVAGCHIYFNLDAELLANFASQPQFSTTDATVSCAELVKNEALDVAVSFKATGMTFKQLCQLREGDFVPLQQSIESPVKVAISGSESGLGFLVNKDGKKSVYLVS